MGLLDFFKSKPKEAQKITSVLPHEIFESAALELRDIIAPSALKVSPRDINLGDKIVRTLFVISYPRYLSDNWFSPIINLDTIFDISIYIHPIDTAKILNQFHTKLILTKFGVLEENGQKN